MHMCVYLISPLLVRQNVLIHPILLFALDRVKLQQLARVFSNREKQKEREIGVFFIAHPFGCARDTCFVTRNLGVGWQACTRDVNERAARVFILIILPHNRSHLYLLPSDKHHRQWILKFIIDEASRAIQKIKDAPQERELTMRN